MLNFKGYYLKIKKRLNKTKVKKHLSRKFLSIKGFNKSFQHKEQLYKTLYIKLFLAIEMSIRPFEHHHLLNSLQPLEYI
jgi:hypothetical protein